MRLDGAVQDVAVSLLGAHISCGGTVVRLTEVEAYAGEGDPGSHAYRGPTPRTRVMFGPPGRAYVYLSYGMHWCLNVVTGPAGSAAAVLLRAGQVVQGLDIARARRPGARDRDLARGPARLTRALGVDGAHDGADLLDPAGALRLLPGMTGPGGPPGAPLPALPAVDPGPALRTGPRVGVAGAGAGTPWRFWLDGEASVSAYRPAVVRAGRGGGTQGSGT